MHFINLQEYLVAICVEVMVNWWNKLSYFSCPKNIKTTESKGIFLTHNSPDFIKYFQLSIFLEPKQRNEIALIELNMYNSILTELGLA